MRIGWWDLFLIPPSVFLGFVIRKTLMGTGFSYHYYSNSYLYSGKEIDRMNGLNEYDFSARWMDNAVPCFTTPDPLAENHPWESPYSYCGANPVNRTDPTGLEWCRNDNETLPIWTVDATQIKSYKYHSDNDQIETENGIINYYPDGNSEYIPFSCNSAIVYGKNDYKFRIYTLATYTGGGDFGNADTAPDRSTNGWANSGEIIGEPQSTIQKNSIANQTTFLLNSTKTAATALLRSEGKTVEILNSIEKVGKLGKVVNAIDAISIGIDVFTAKVQTSTVTDGIMLVGGVGIGIVAGPVVAGVVGAIYGASMLMGGQDALNKTFNGDWNNNINSAIRRIQNGE